MKNKHKGLQVNKRVFFISVDYPFIGASRDGIIQCRCRDEGLLGIKCPFTYRALSINDYAAKTDVFFEIASEFLSCFEIVDNHIQFKRNHSFQFIFKYNFFSSTMSNGSHRKKMVWFFGMCNSRQFLSNYKL